MPGGEGFKSNGWTKHSYLSDMSQVVFYPNLTFDSHRVYPEHWHPESEQPIVYCVTGSSEWPYPLETEADARQMMEYFIANEWDYNPKDQEARKYIHVDDLEKIEGPPPEGAF